MTTAYIKSLPIKTTDYGAIELASSKLRKLLDDDFEKDITHRVSVVIEAVITFPINSFDGIGQEFALNITKVKHK